MFDNIGGKIKNLAVVICWVGIILSIIIGISLMGLLEEIGFVGIIVMIVGSLFSWIGSFFMYGFGQLIENSDKLVNGIVKANKDIKKKSHQKNDDVEKMENIGEWECPKCGNIWAGNVDFCTCGEERNK